MKTEIKKGITIIHTAEDHIGVYNKNNKTGISRQATCDGSIKYRAEIQVNRKKHYLGLRDTVEEASALRQEAEEQVKKGTFHEWLENEVKPSFCRNKHKKTGISKNKLANGALKYEAVIHVNKKRYYLGCSRKLEEAVAFRTEAEKHLENGTFHEWQESKRKSKQKNEDG